MKLRKTKRFLFTILISTIALLLVYYTDKYFFVEYDITEFMMGFFCSTVSILARSWFNTKFPKDGEIDIINIFDKK